MYQVSQKTKMLSMASIAIGLVLWIAGFFMTSKTMDEVKDQMVHHDTEHVEAHGDTHKDSHATAVYSMPHEQHEYYKANNRPWSALYIAIIFFTLVGLGASFFMAIQHAAQVGWSMVVIRVMEGLASFVPIGGVLVLIMFGLSAAHIAHIFEWMDPAFVHKFVILNADGSVLQYVNEMTEGAIVNGDFDSLIAGKSAYLNSPFFIIRAVIYILGWTFFIRKLKSLTRKLDNTTGAENNRTWRTLRDWSAGYLVFFAVSSSMLAWDWVMSVEPHWFSTLFGWYTLVSYFVSAIAMILLFSLFLKGKGVMNKFTVEHQHDLTKFMFGLSIMWTYLWFSQFMLYWYANVPEEIVYFLARFDIYGGKYLLILTGFFIPVITLMSSSIKRKSIVTKVLAIFILVVHYLDMYFWIMPGSVGYWSGFGLPEIGGILFVLGVFLYVVNQALASNDLEHKGSPFWHESETYHYPH